MPVNWTRKSFYKNFYFFTRAIKQIPVVWEFDFRRRFLFTQSVTLERQNFIYLFEGPEGITWPLLYISLPNLVIGNYVWTVLSLTGVMLSGLKTDGQCVEW